MANEITIILQEEEGTELELTITPSSLSLNPQLRKHVFRAAKEGNPVVVEWLKEHFHLKIWTQQEIDDFNKELERKEKDGRNNSRNRVK